MKRKIESLIGRFRQEIKRASGEVPNKEQIKNMATDRQKPDTDVINALLLHNSNPDFFEDESLALFLYQHRPSMKSILKSLFKAIEFPKED